MLKTDYNKSYWGYFCSKFDAYFDKQRNKNTIQRRVQGCAIQIVKLQNLLQYLHILCSV